MRKQSLLLSLLLITVFLSACNEIEAIEPTEETMVVSVLNNANFDIYMIEINAGNTGGGMGYADGSKIRKGDIFSMVYANKVDIDLKGKERFDFAVISEEDERIDLQDVTLELKPNKQYFFEISGNTAEEAYLTMIESNDSLPEN